MHLVLRSFAALFIVASAVGAEPLLPAREAVRQLGIGINLGNTLEPPAEGAWNNPPAEERYFCDLRAAGFTWVRLPVHWGTHLAEQPPHTLDAVWLDRVEQVVDWALAAGLSVSVDAHHEQWIKDSGGAPAAKDRFVALWQQIGERFAHKSPRLILELLHDPVGLPQPTIDELNARCLAAIRAHAPTRLVAISSLLFPARDEVLAAAVPDDPYVLGTVYFFHPPTFTFEGQGTWGSETDYGDVRAFFDSLVGWSEKNRLPLVLREFGVTSKADASSRRAFYAAVASGARAHGIACAAWDDGTEFEIYQRSSGTWNPIKDCIIAPDPETPSGASSAP